MKKECKVSIIVPIYRVEKYLDQCIQSLMNQTLKDIEIILVDDGSDDKCPQICDYYATLDHRIRVIHKENGGQDSARKAGFAVATGQYVGYVDGDDWVDATMYEKLLLYATSYDVSVVESGAIDFWGEKERRRLPYFEEGVYKEQKFCKEIEPYMLYSGKFFQHGVTVYLWSKLFERKAIKKYQLMQDAISSTLDDVSITFPTIAETKSIYITHECFYHYRVRIDSSKREIRSDDSDWCLKHFSVLKARFNGSRLNMAYDRQLMYYAMYSLLMKTPAVFDNQTEHFFTPIGKLKQNSNVVLYGAGVVGIHWKDYFTKKGLTIVKWVDKNYEMLSKTIDVCCPEDIFHTSYDYVVIAILNEVAVQSAKRDLMAIGVPKNKILWIDQQYIRKPELLVGDWVIGGEE